MEATRILLMFFTIQGGSRSDKENPYCTSQRGSIIVEEKGSVTLSCNFTHPESKEKDVDVRVSWRRSQTDRCGTGSFIYNHTDGWTDTNYMGRITPVGNPKEGTATITINDLRRSTDRYMFCCRVEIYEESNKKPTQGWQNRHGTFIQFKDELSVEQTDVVPAIIGEDIIIPCLVHYKSSRVIEEVTWTVGSSDLCSENNERSETWKQSAIRGRWAVVNFPEDLSLRIKKVTSEDIKQYCCKIQTTLRDTSTQPPSLIHGTQVVVVETSRNPLFEVVQPKTTSRDQTGSAAFNCFFTNQAGMDPLWIAVFWRVGSPTGPYAYHPFTNMVDPVYGGRTELSGVANLLIKGVREADNTTYYCFVMLKFCVGNNKTKSTIQYGGGTRLVVEVTDGKSWIYVLAAVLAAVIILCAVIIIILKKRGVICQKRNGLEDVNYLTSDIALKDQNASDHVRKPSAAASAPPMAHEDSGGILYAGLNVSSLQQKTSNGRKGRKLEDSKVLYAAVKPTDSPQDIYSTVK